MTIRTKTIRRLLLIAATAAASAAIVGAAFTYRRAAHDAELANARVAGMTAYEAGDLAGAMKPLTSYVAARPDDVDAIYALACAYFGVETPGHDNLFDARSRFQQVLARQPDHLLAKRQLMKIYERTRLPRESLVLADDILKTLPGDIEATRERAVALSELERDNDALPAWEAYLALAPTDFRAQSQLLATMKKTGHAPEELVAHARANMAKSPDDPRLVLPLAAALREAGSDAEAQALLEAAAAKPQTDPVFIVELAAALDRVRSFDTAERLLARSADTLKSTTLSAALVERMWQNGRHAQVITATDGLLTAGKRDASVLAIRALSLWATGHQSVARSLAQEIGAIPANPQAAAWTSALAIEFGTSTMTPAEQARQLHEALDRDPDNAILYAWLGRALRASGESEQAARCFKEAAQRLPSWSTPCVELADTMLEAGRNAEAAAAAKAAFLRAPTNLGVQLEVARVRFAELSNKASPAALSELLARVDELSRLLPSDPSLPAMRVSLLAAQGQREAADAAAVSAMAALPHGSNLQPLYDAARAAGAIASDRVFSRALAEGAVTPSMALSHAIDLAQTAPGVSAITWMATQAAAHPNDVAWALADVRVRQQLGDPQTRQAWADLLARFPNEPSALSAALSDGGDLIDRVRQATIVERLKIVAGPDASIYRIARARWLGSSADDGEARQALTLAADLVRAQPGRAELRVLLAHVLVRLDSAGTAVDHLRAAHDQQPADVSITLDLADTLRRAGRWAEGIAILKAQADYVYDQPGPRDALASALLEAGAFPEVIRVFDRAAERSTIFPDEQLLRASAFNAMGDAAGEAAAYAAASAAESASPATLARVAAFERRQGHADQAAALLQRIDHSSATADERAAAAAQYATEFGDIDAARARYTAALAAGAGVDLTLNAINFEADQGKFDAAAAMATKAAERFPDEPRVKRTTLELAARKAAVDGSNDTAALDALIASMAGDPAMRREAAALKAVRQAGTNERPTPELATRLVSLADAYPASVELAQRAISASILAHQPQPAGAIARRLLSSSGTRVDAVALAAQTLLQIGDLPAARRAAERWRSMTQAAPEMADVTLARIALAENAPVRALAVLQPYRAAISWDREPLLPAVLAEALAKTGAANDAFDLLDPALGSQPAARAAWYRIVDISRDATGEMAATRLGHLELQTPPDATDEQVRLGGAFLELAESCGTPRAVEHGLALLTPLEKSGRLAGNGRALLAEMQRVAGQPDLAEKTLRNALAAEPENAMLKNSLAYLLLQTPEKSAEACRLADEATAAAPTMASFQDTRARAYLAANDLTKAELAFREALRIDENCLDAWVGLAGLQAKSGHRTDAQNSVKRLDAAMARASMHDAPLHLRAELHDVRESVVSARD